MSRTAEIDRKTAETEIRVTLGLDGNGSGERETGVGFLDHMLDLFARHGRLDLEVHASGDLHTGAHHTVEDVGICIGQALDRALGNRAGIARYGEATVPMDEARASCAIDISGRGLCVFEGSLPPGAIGNFDHELAEEFCRAVAMQRQADAAPDDRDGHERASRDRSDVQGAGTSVAVRRRSGSERGRGAEHQGHACMRPQTAPLIAVVDYGMGNRRSVEKALEHVGARARVSRDPETLLEADGLIVPGVGAFPVAMRNLHELGLVALLRERVAQATPLLGICLGMQLLFERSNELGETEGLGLIPGSVSRLRTGGLRVPHIGWSEVRFERASPLTVGLPDGGCPFYHVHSFAARPADPADVVGTADYGERFATDRRARGPCSASSFTPRSHPATACGCSRNFSALCAAQASRAQPDDGARMILLPAIDILDGKAVG